MRRALLLLLWPATLCAYPSGVPDPSITQERVQTTICVPGWTSTARPSTYFTNKLKRQQLPSGADLSRYEEDHILPLSLGGAPRDPGNLMPQLWAGKCGARMKDVAERELHRQVCRGRKSLAEAQKYFMPWVCDE